MSALCNPSSLTSGHGFHGIIPGIPTCLHELLARSAWPCRAAHIVAVLPSAERLRKTMAFYGILWHSMAFYGILWHSMAFSQVEGHTKRLGMVETWWDSVTDMCRPEPSPIGLLAANSHSTVRLIENSERSRRIIGSVFCCSNLQKWIQPDLSRSAFNLWLLPW